MSHKRRASNADLLNIGGYNDDPRRRVTVVDEDEEHRFDNFAMGTRSWFSYVRIYKEDFPEEWTDCKTKELRKQFDDTDIVVTNGSGDTHGATVNGISVSADYIDVEYFE